MANVGKNIRKLREKRKLTQDELAGKLFVSRQTVSNYETGKSNPDIDMLVRIAEILNTDVNSLIFGIPTPPHRKKEMLRFFIYSVFTLFWGSAVALLIPFADKWRSDYFDFGPSLIIATFIKPAFYLSLGLLIMQFCFLFLHARIKRSVKAQIAYLILFTFAALYFLLFLPICVDITYYTIQFHRLINQGIEFSSSDIANLIPAGYTQIGFNIYPVLRKFLYFFLPLGMALRAVKPDSGTFNLCRRKNPDIPQQSPLSDKRKGYSDTQNP